MHNHHNLAASPLPLQINCPPVLEPSRAAASGWLACELGPSARSPRCVLTSRGAQAPRRERPGHGGFQRCAWAWTADWPMLLDLADRGSPGTQRGRVVYGCMEERSRGRRLDGGSDAMVIGLRCRSNQGSESLSFFSSASSSSSQDTASDIATYSISARQSSSSCSILYLCLHCCVQKAFASLPLAPPLLAVG